jgi:hypothetical protein
MMSIQNKTNPRKKVRRRPLAKLIMQICRHPIPSLPFPSLPRFPRYAKLQTQPKPKVKANAKAHVRPEAAPNNQHR